jgi:hypothetical protein
MTSSLFGLRFALCEQHKGRTKESKVYMENAQVLSASVTLRSQGNPDKSFKAAAAGTSPIVTQTRTHKKSRHRRQRVSHSTQYANPPAYARRKPDWVRQVTIAILVGFLAISITAFFVLV